MNPRPALVSSPKISLVRLWAVTGGLLAVSIAMLAIAAAVSGCSGAARSILPAVELAVTSFSPQQATDDPRAPIRLRFSHPVVSAELVGRALSSPPVEIHPPVRVAGHWSDRQTLVLRPLAGLRPSTRYAVNLVGTLAQRAQARSKTRFVFVHRPLGVLGLSGVNPTATPPRPTFALRFNQPVAAADVLDHCSLRLDGNLAGEVALQTPDPRATASSVALSPRVALAPGERYELRCAGLTGTGGNAALAAPLVTELQTCPALAVTEAGPRGDQVSASEVRVRLQFSTPVSLQQVREQLKISPPVRGFSAGVLDRSQTRYVVEVDLRVSTRYRVHLGAGLTDLHGQKLGRAYSYTFKTGDASPQLSLEKGIYALERDSDGYPVWSRNVSRFQLACARVPRDRIVSLLTSSMDYDPWFDASSDIHRLRFERHGLKPQRRAIAPTTMKRNRWQLHHLRLHDLCSSRSTTTTNGPRDRQLPGLFVAEISSAQVARALRERGARNGGYYHYRYPFRLLANVTDLGVLVKAGTASGLVWVARVSDGKPVSAAQVTLYSPQGKRVFAGRTDQRGILPLPGTTRLLAGRGTEPDDHDSHRAQRMIAVVEKGDDLAVVDGNWQNGIQIWNFGVDVDRQAGLSRVRGFIQSDRGIYRPGEKVHFKGLVRELRIGQPPRVPSERRVQLEVRDPRGSTLYRRRLPLTRFGGFAFDLPLSAQARLGDYAVSAAIQGQTFREQFQVEAFRKVSYELTLRRGSRRRPAGQHARLGRRVELLLDARYLFGPPVRSARVRWSVQRRPHALRFAGLPQYVFSDDAAAGRYFWDGDRDSYPSFVADGEGETDDDGRYLLRFVDSNRRVSEPQDYLVQATASDQTDQSVTRRTVVTAHRSDLYVGLHPQEYVQAVQLPFSINTVAVAPDGARVATPASLSLVRQQHRCGYERGGGPGRASWRCTQRQELVWSREISIPKTGSGSERIVIQRPGEYVVRLQATDGRGVQVAASRHIWVLGKGEAFWSGDESARMSLVASKPSYLPGETARLVPRTAIAAGATALVTLERNGVLQAQVVALETSGDGIAVPITETHAPNVFASVVLVRGRTGAGDSQRPRFKIGTVDLKVSPVRSRLKVAIETERQHYQPGEAVQGKLRVTDAAGQPVRAEVSLSVADEGVLQLIAYQTPDPMKTFYAPWGLGVDSSTNWNRIARLSDPRRLESDEEGGDGDGGPDTQRVRSRFVSSAFWAAALLTDEHGEVSFSFAAPDNLTAFRLMGVAADPGSRFGSGESRVTISKPLLARPVLPRFLSAGDRVQLGVVVHNHTDVDGQVQVGVAARGLQLRRRSRSVRVRHGGSARVGFAAQVPLSSRRATVTFAVSMGKHRDALRLQLPVSRPVVVERRTLAHGALRDGQVAIPVDSATLERVAGGGGAVLAADSRLEVTVDRTGMSDLAESLRYLVRYPYGCLEQTLSGFIPLTKVEDLARSLQLEELRGPRLQGFIRAGVAKVARHQHPDGHFSLWPSGGTYPHLTAYALYGLDEARRAGVAVDAAVLARGTRALASWANGSARTIEPGGESATMAMAAYVLARMGRPDAGLNARLFEARQALPVYGKAFLARALKIARAPADQVAALTSELERAIVRDREQAIVDENRANPRPLPARYMGSNVRSSAITLSSLLELAPASGLSDQLARGLMASRQPGGSWYNTQDNIYALVALADYARRQTAGSGQVTLSLDGRRLTRARLHAGRSVVTLSRPLSHLAHRSALQIAVQGRASYSARLVLARQATAQEQPKDRGLSVAREHLDQETGEPLPDGQVRAGQLVRVRLTLKTTRDRSYVALVDPLPAGIEAVNQRLATSEQSRGYRPSLQPHGWTHCELRDDQVQAFADRMSAGSLVLEYLARATIPGRFTAAPARAEAMYDPDVRGRSAAARIAVTER